MKTSVSFVSLLLLIPCIATAAGAPVVSYDVGLLTVRCNEVPISEVFEQIKARAGIELILEDEVKGKRLTANIEAQPVHLAIERLLEGSGVNFVVFFDHVDIQRVDKVFIGAGGGGPARSATPASTARTTRRRPARRTEPVEDPYEDDMMDMEEPDEYIDDDMSPEELDEMMDPEMEADGTQGGANPFLPPTPNYRRSTRTPGLESSPFNNQQQQAQPQTPDPGGNEQPPAYMPFLDPLGRPIPVPGQQQPQQKKDNKN
jgi:hypothetical protein